MTELAVAMSGGVDSTVAAWRLARAGHEVLGLTLDLGMGSQTLESAQQAARQLGIPWRAVPAAVPFRERVVEPAVRAYSQGLTPNPCGVCNATLKLPLLWRAAREAGAVALATGHYARLAWRGRHPLLCQATHGVKSQTYFLARVAPELLSRLVFPLGGLTKPQVRDLAQEAGLAAAQRPDSQDCCFLPAGGWDELTERAGLARPGLVTDPEGRELARHQGLHRFTVGQRRGLGVTLGYPAYVWGLDPERAEVRVGPRSCLVAAGLRADRALWHHPLGPRAARKVRMRYAHQGVNCRVIPHGGELAVWFEETQYAVAPGQLAVFQRGPLVVGSAWITAKLTDSERDI